MAEGFTITCPSCGKRLQVPPNLAGKRAKCSCGQSLLVPATPGATAQLATAANVPPASLGYRSATAPSAATNHEHSALIRQAILYTLILLVIVGGIFSLRFIGSSKSSSTTPALGEDADVEQMMRDENGTEVRAWLADRRGRMLSGMTDTQAEHRIDDWYNMGATKVYAFGGTLSMTVALELPANPAKRKALFDWVNHWHQDMPNPIPPMSDVGQKYLLVRLKL